MKNRFGKPMRFLSLLIAAAIICTLMPVNLCAAEETAYIYGDRNTGMENSITAGGVYYLADGASGIVNIKTSEQVILIGDENGMTYENLYIDCTEQVTKLTLQNVRINCNDGSGLNSTIDFSGSGNELSFEGISIIDYSPGFVSPAAIHVGKDTELTIKGSGTIYLYKSAAGAGIGGNKGELNGDIAFDMDGEFYAKGTKQSALIGAGANAASHTETPGSVSFVSGTFNLMTNSRGACIGGAAGSDGASAGTTVYVGKDACVNINVDYSGAAVGGGGYATGNDAAGGTLYVAGGSLRTFVDLNAANGSVYGYHGAIMSMGVNDAAITAQRLNNPEDNSIVYKCIFNTELMESAADYFEVTVDGNAFYSGGLHSYKYLNETIDKPLQTVPDTTPENWIENTDSCLYFYLTGENHNLTVNGEAFKVTFDESVTDANTLCTVGPFTVKPYQPEEETTLYAVSYSVNGGEAEVNLSTEEAAEGETVSVTVTGVPEGSRIASVTAADENGNAIEVTAGESGTFELVMPACDAYISVEIEQEGDNETEYYNLSLPSDGDTVCSIAVSADETNQEGKIAAGATVTVTVTGVPEGSRIASVTAADENGNAIEVTAGEPGTYELVMPDCDAYISVEIEQKGDSETEYYNLSLPSDGDTVCSIAVSADETNQEGKIAAGASVTVIVEKNEKALGTMLEGITVSGVANGDISVSNERFSNDYCCYAEYSFIMPEQDCSVSLILTYSELTVMLSDGSKRKVYSRDELSALAGVNEGAYQYSAWKTGTHAVIGGSDSYIKLIQLLSDAGVEFNAGDTLTVTDMNSISVSYSYDSLFGQKRYFASDIISAGKEAAQRYEILPVIAISSGYVSETGDSVEIEYNTTDACCLIIGQSENEITGGIENKDNYVPYICAITVTKAIYEPIDPIPAEVPSAPNSTIWDGVSVDISWYDENSTSFVISTAAQLAGAAALVNGLVNTDCMIYTSEGRISADKWNSDTRFVNTSDNNSPGKNNMSTTVYHYGIEKFENKTIVLAADLDMSAGNYMPIGGQFLMSKNVSETRIDASFCGTFDGCGHYVIISCDRHCSNGNYGDGSSVGFIGRLGVHDNEIAIQPQTACIKNLAVFGTVKGNRSVGGVLGKIGKTAEGGVIMNCANFADITATDAKGTGGIVGAGWNGGLISDCYNCGSVTNTQFPAVGGISGSNESKIINCYSTGKITGPSGAVTSAIASENGGGSYTNCYWLEGTADTGVYKKTTETVFSKTEAEMKSDDTVEALGEAFAADSGSINNGYPILLWQKTDSGNSEDDNENTGSGDSDNEDTDSGDGNTEESEAANEITADGDSASIALSDKAAENSINEAKEKNDNRIIINAADKAYAAETVVTLSSEAADSISQNGLGLLIKTADGSSAEFSSDALHSIAGQAAGSEIRMEFKAVSSAEASDAIESSGISGEDTEKACFIEVNIAADEKAITKFEGILKLMLPVPEGLEENKEIIVYQVSADGSVEKHRGMIRNAEDTLYTEINTVHLSTFIVTAAPANPYSDIEGSWAYDAIVFAYLKNLFNGVSETEFAPKGFMTRAMLVSMLYRMDGMPEVTQSSGFKDVEEGLWYSDAISWARTSGITEGYSGELFGTDDYVTREQFAVFMFRYAALKGYAVNCENELTAYSDTGSISSWAYDAVAWANEKGLFIGRTDSTIVPKGNATRAEAATILMRFIQNLEN